MVTISERVLKTVNRKQWRWLLYSNYIKYLEQCGKSPHYIKWSQGKIRYFVKWLNNDRGVKTYLEVTEKDLLQFFQGLYDKRSAGILSQDTIDGYWRALHASTKWCYEQGYLRTNYMANVPRPHPAKKLQSILTDNHIDLLLEYIESTDTAETQRDRLIILLLLDTGMRLSELANIHRYDINLSDHQIKITGKGSKERLVSYGDKTSRLLVECLHTYPSKKGYLFTTVNGEPLKSRSIDWVLRKTMKAVAIEGIKPGAHTYRHTMATRFLDAGGDSLELQRILGHETLAMVKRYTDTNINQRALAKQRKLSLMDRLASTPPRIA